MVDCLCLCCLHKSSNRSDIKFPGYNDELRHFYIITAVIFHFAHCHFADWASYCTHISFWGGHICSVFSLLLILSLQVALLAVGNYREDKYSETCFYPQHNLNKMNFLWRLEYIILNKGLSFTSSPWWFWTLCSGSGAEICGSLYCPWHCTLHYPLVEK